MTIVSPINPGMAPAVSAAPSDPARFEISVVIVNWNTAELLLGCVDSVVEALGGRAAEVIVVDNGSADDSVERLGRTWPEVRIVANETNLGYQAACNQGSAVASGEFLLHINTDARIGRAALDGLIGVLRGDETVGVVGPRLEYADGSFQRWTAGRLPSLRSLASSFLLLDRVLSRSGVWLVRDEQVGRQVEWVSSACLLVRRQLFVDVGGLDERLFVYMDDVDLGAAMAAHGVAVRYEPTVTVVHYMGGSQDHPATVASTAAVDSLVTWFGLHTGRRREVVARMIIAAGLAGRGVIHLLRGNRVDGSALLLSSGAVLSKKGTERWRSR